MRGSTSAAVTAVRLPGSALVVLVGRWGRWGRAGVRFFFLACTSPTRSPAASQPRSRRPPLFSLSPVTATPPKPDGHRSTLSNEASEAYAHPPGGGGGEAPSGSGRGGAGSSTVTEPGGGPPAASPARLASADSDGAPAGPVHPPLTPPPLGDATTSGGSQEAATTTAAAADDDGEGDDTGAGLALPIRSVRWVDADGGAALAAVREFEASEDGDGSVGSAGGGVAGGAGPHPACCSLM